MLQPLNPKALQALRIIRNRLVHDGSSPSIRELMREMGYKFPRSAAVLIERLIAGGYVRRTSAGLQILREPPADFQRASTVRVPLVGRVSCGTPIWAAENVEAFVPVATTIARPGSQYFILRAEGDSMNRAGIDDGDLVLIRQQATAEEGDRVVALIDDEATIKELRFGPTEIILKPRSTNPKHKPIILDREFHIQGVVAHVLKGGAELMES